jgi:hypothetical protein
MAIDPLGEPQPVKLAIMPLAAARQAVRLTSEQNQQVREARLTADRKAANDQDAAKAAAAKVVAARAARQAADAKHAERAAAVDQLISATADSRGDRLNIVA